MLSVWFTVKFLACQFINRIDVLASHMLAHKIQDTTFSAILLSLQNLFYKTCQLLRFFIKQTCLSSSETETFQRCLTLWSAVSYLMKNENY
jgi:hypothetical protein